MNAALMSNEHYWDLQAHTHQALDKGSLIEQNRMKNVDSLAKVIYEGVK